jgi:hypothetical protein
MREEDLPRVELRQALQPSRVAGQRCRFTVTGGGQRKVVGGELRGEVVGLPGQHHRAPGRLELRGLYDDRPAGQQVVPAAVVEVEVAVGNDRDVGEGEPGSRSSAGLMK